jgi:short-subunit dehydrogenase
MKMTDLKNAWALVTGASSGIGKVYAMELAKLGMNIIVVARRADKLSEVKSEIEKKYNREVVIIQSDLSLRDAPREVFEQATENRQIQVVINNAGIGFYGPLEDHELSQYQQTIDLNISSVTAMTYLFLKHMKEHGLKSYITNIASIAAYQGIPYFGVYCGSKKYVRDFTEALSYEYRKSNIHLCCVCPGGTYTEFTQHSGQELKKAGHASMMSAEKVVQIGLKSMFNRRVTIITGFINFLACQVGRILPGCVALWVGHQAMKNSVSYKKS